MRTFALALALACAAVLMGGARGQAPSAFLSATRDVFSSVSPSIDPVKALVARTRITMTEAAAAAPVRRLNQFFGQGVAYSVVDARRVASFQVVARTDEVTLRDALATWAAVAPADVAVVATSATSNVYNVTIAPTPLPGRYSSSDEVDGLLASIDAVPVGGSGLDLCSALATTSVAVANGSCPNSITNRVAGLRYLVDAFADFGSNYAEVGVALSAQRDFTNIIQYERPTVLPSPRQGVQWGAVAVLVVTSVVFIAASAGVQYYLARPKAD